MGVLERRAREKEALRASILDAATSLFIEEGYEHVSIRKIADRIEYSPATIYLYFKDKADLIAAICEEAFREMLETIGAAASSSDNPLIALRAGLRAYIDFGLHHPNHYQIVFNFPAASAAPDPACEHPMSLALQTFDLLRQAIRGCVESGSLPATDVETAAQTTWMAIHGITSLAISATKETCSGFPWLDRNHLVESALDVVIAGLCNTRLKPE